MAARILGLSAIVVLAAWLVARGHDARPLPTSRDGAEPLTRAETAAAPVELRPAPAGSVEHAQSARVDAVDSEGPAVFGRVTRRGLPVANRLVRLHGTLENGDHVELSVTTGSDGAFRTAAAAGRYLVGVPNLFRGSAPATDS